MSTVLALETATEGFGVAIYVNSAVISESAVLGRGHAEAILPSVQRLMAQAQLTGSDVDVIAFDRGPGAFTGVRIALAAAQGLAMGWDRPLVGVSSLAAMAYAVWSIDDSTSRSDSEAAVPTSVLAALDARMGELYWACLALSDVLADRIDERLMTPEQLMAHGLQRGLIGCGHGFKAYPQLVSALGLSTVDAAALPSVDAVAHLGAAYYEAGWSVAAELAEAVYVRNDVAHRAKQ